MTSALPKSLLTDFSYYVSKEIGLYFPKQKMKDLERGVEEASKVFKFNDVESCIHWLMSTSLNQKQAEILASVLTIGETYFFRDPNVFIALEKHILPKLIYRRIQNNQKYLRIWSAGCASGEEPYSIAILLFKLIPDIQNWNITLLASDINTDFLNKLSRGIYSEWSFRGVSTEIKRNFFHEKKNGKYEISSKIKNMVQAKYLNLAKDSFPSLMNNTNAMDVIFCRNVLMYFSEQMTTNVVKSLFSCLVEDGCLIVGAGDSASPAFNDFEMELVERVSIYKKTSKNSIEHVMCEPPKPLPIKEAVIVKATPKQEIEDYKSSSIEYANQGKFNEALTSNDKAILLNKTDADLHYMRAMICIEMNNDQEAIAALQRVIFLNDKFVLAYIVLGNLLHKLKKNRMADSHFESALTLLADKQQDELVGDIAAGRLTEIVRSMKEME